MLRWITGDGAAILEVSSGDAKRLTALLEKYRDRPMDIADASLVVVAERIGVSEILTIDRADFDVYRLSGNRRFVQVL
jgi:predicted nucleic acid-binding protein